MHQQSKLEKINEESSDHEKSPHRGGYFGPRDFREVPEDEEEEEDCDEEIKKDPKSHASISQESGLSDSLGSSPLHGSLSP